MLTRRSFLALTAAGAASASARAVQAIEPIARHGAARIKLSLAAYSFRNMLTGQQKSMTLDDFIDRAAAWDLDAVEPTSYYFPESPTPEYCRRLRRHAFLLGLAISGTAVRNTFTYPPGPQLQKEIAHVKHWVDLAVELGAPTIRIFAGDLQKGTTETQAREWCIQAIQECCDYAGTRGIILALENHGGIVSTADQLLSIVKEVDSDWFGVNWDSGNFESADAYAELAAIAPYAVTCQIKANIGSPKGSVPADWNRVIGILRDAGYRGWVSLEYEEDEDAKIAVPRLLKELERLT